MFLALQVKFTVQGLLRYDLQWALKDLMWHRRLCTVPQFCLILKIQTLLLLRITPLKFEPLECSAPYVCPVRRNICCYILQSTRLFLPKCIWWNCPILSLLKVWTAEVLTLIINYLRLDTDGDFPCWTRWLPLNRVFPRTSWLCLQSGSNEWSDCKTSAGSFF